MQGGTRQSVLGPVCRNRELQEVVDERERKIRPVTDLKQTCDRPQKDEYREL